MPSSNGVYSLPVGYLAVTGSTIQASQHNPPLEDIAAALTGRLSRDGTAPMTGALALAAGTVAAPGVAFATDPTTGFYKTAAGFGVAVAGVKVAEFVAGGIIGARYIGELIPCMLSTAPPLCVFPVGQTLSRTTYAALWAVAQAELVAGAGNLFFNNGNGSTTFGIGDLRGRVIATRDGSGAVLNATIMTPNGDTMGAIGGAQTVQLTLSQLPTGITSSGTNTINVSGNQSNMVQNNGGFSSLNPAGGSGGCFTASGLVSALNPTASGSNSIAVTSNNTSGGLHSNVQPTTIANYALFAGA